MMKFSVRLEERSMGNKEYELRYLPLFYEDLDHDVSYITFILNNPSAANRLLDDVEAAILERLEIGPEMFEPVQSRKDRLHPYYRIYVRNYVIYYVVFEENGQKVMEVRRFLHLRENRDRKI